MTTVSATQARKDLYDLIEEVSSTGKRIGITNKGETKAVLMSTEEVASWEATMDVMSDKELVKGIKKGIEDIKKGKVIAWEESRKKLGFKMAQIILSKTAEKSFLKLPKQAKLKIQKGIEKLVKDPLVGEKLRGEYEGQFKLYAWPYRIVYLFSAEDNLVTIVEVEHRQGEYKK